MQGSCDLDFFNYRLSINLAITTRGISTGTWGQGMGSNCSVRTGSMIGVGTSVPKGTMGGFANFVRGTNLVPGAIPVSSLPHCYDMHIHCVPQRYTAFHCAPVHARQCSRPASFLEPSLQNRSDWIIVWVKGMLDEVPPQSQLWGSAHPFVGH